MIFQVNLLFIFAVQVLRLAVLAWLQLGPVSLQQCVSMLA